MARLIIVPQYPTPLRYQEWWLTCFEKEYGNYFSEVINIKPDIEIQTANGEISNVQQSLRYESLQIEKYLELKLLDDDILLLNDISFPGIFPHVLLHKRPKKSYAICHATSANYEDYYAKDLSIKLPIELSVFKLFDTVFVATNYHKSKLKMPNIEVVALPNPPDFLIGRGTTFEEKDIDIIVASRKSKQKRDAFVEAFIERNFQFKIEETTTCTSWEEYYKKLRRSKILLISSKEETYGYQVIDAINNGCYVIAPKDYSYPELLDEKFLYSTPNELVEVIKQCLNHKLPMPKNLMNKQSESFFKVTSKLMSYE